MATIPTNPSDGDTFTDGAGVTWTYNSSSNKWLIPLATAGGGGGSGNTFASTQSISQTASQGENQSGVATSDFTATIPADATRAFIRGYSTVSGRSGAHGDVRVFINGSTEVLHLTGSSNGDNRDTMVSWIMDINLADGSIMTGTGFHTNGSSSPSAGSALSAIQVPFPTRLSDGNAVTGIIVRAEADGATSSNSTGRSTIVANIWYDA